MTIVKQFKELLACRNKTIDTLSITSLERERILQGDFSFFTPSRMCRICGVGVKTAYRYIQREKDNLHPMFTYRVRTEKSVMQASNECKLSKFLWMRYEQGDKIPFELVTKIENYIGVPLTKYIRKESKSKENDYAIRYNMEHPFDRDVIANFIGVLNNVR
jgi:hypothetical protein